MSGGVHDVYVEDCSFAGRVMYGSDHPVGMGGLSDIYQDLKDLSISEETKQAMREGAPKAYVSRFVPGFDWSRGLDGFELGTEKRGSIVPHRKEG